MRYIFWRTRSCSSAFRWKSKERSVFTFFLDSLSLRINWRNLFTLLQTSNCRIWTIYISDRSKKRKMKIAKNELTHLNDKNELIKNDFKIQNNPISVIQIQFHNSIFLFIWLFRTSQQLDCMFPLPEKLNQFVLNYDFLK